MKNKLSFISLAAVVGLVGVGFGAWAFGEATTAEQGVTIGIEAAVQGNLGLLEITAHTADYTIKEAELDDITFTAKFTAKEDLPAGAVGTMTYEVAVPLALQTYLTVGGDGVFESEVQEVLTVAWKAGMKPVLESEYLALKAVVDGLGDAKIVISLDVADNR